MAAAVQEWGAGIVLPGDADSEAMRLAAKEVLANSSYRANTKERAHALAGIDGAANAANEVEALLPRMVAGGRGNVDRREHVPGKTGQGALAIVTA